MATLNNRKIKDTYEGLLKTSDNTAIDGIVEITDGVGNSTGVSISNDGSLTATGQVTADSFVGDGSGLTNIPHPADTVTSVNGEIGDVVLSTSDIEESANLYYTDARVSSNTDVVANSAKNSYPSEDASKLAGIESGAQVNVQSDWNADSGDAFIVNKPTLFSGSYNDLTDKPTIPTDTNDLSDVSDTAPSNGQVLQYSSTTSKYEPITLSSTAPVDSVNGQTGAVVLDTDDVSEGSTNLYYTEARVSANTNVATNTAKVSFPEAPNDGDAYVRQSESWVSLTHPTDLVTSVNTQTGDVILDTDDISEGTSNLYYTDARVSANTDVIANTAKNSYPTADATKLAGIEAGAEVNPTASEIKTAYESNSDTNAFTDAEKTKLSGIESGAQVNNVTSVNTQTGAVVLDADDIDDTATTNKFTTASDISKLSGIESGADVTDATNVAAAGALMSGTAVISDLNDVASTTPTDGQVLTYDTTNGWQPETPSAGGSVDSVNGQTGVVSLDTADLTDVSTTSPTNGQVLVYNSTSSEYEPTTLSSTAPVDSVNGQTGVVVLDADDISDATTTNKYTTASDITKLAGIESGADVTDATNVTSALSTISVTAHSDVTSAGSGSIITSAERTKVGHISVTQAVDLDTMESDIATNNAKNSYPSADATKVGFISVTQAVDLDTMESDIATNNAKVSNVTTDLSTSTTTTSVTVNSSDGTDATINAASGTAAGVMTTADKNKLDGIAAGAEVNPTSTDGLSEGTTNLYYTEARVSANTDVVANTAKNSYPSADATKVGFISITQAVDLDTIESDVATNNAKVGITAQQASDITANNAKISFDSVSSTKLAGIEAGAQVNTVDSVNTQTGTVVLDADDIDDTSTTNKWATSAEKTKLGFISVTQAVDLDSIEQKQNSQFKAIGLATDFGFRVLSDSGKVEGTQCIMEIMENLILN